MESEFHLVCSNLNLQDEQLIDVVVMLLWFNGPMGLACLHNTYLCGWCNTFQG